MKAVSTIQIMTDRYKIYRENNRELLREKARKYYQDNKEAEREQAREYKKAHADQLSERIACDLCGRFVRRDCMARHKKSKVCQRFRDPEYPKTLKERVGCELLCGRDIYQSCKKKHQATKFCQKHRKKEP